jgi:hypothetical protein
MILNAKDLLRKEIDRWMGSLQKSRVTAAHYCTAVT